MNTINYVYSPEFDKLQALKAVSKTYRGASMGEKHDQDMLNNLRAQTKLCNTHNKTLRQANTFANFAQACGAKDAEQAARYGWYVVTTMRWMAGGGEASWGPAPQTVLSFDKWVELDAVS